MLGFSILLRIMIMFMILSAIPCSSLRDPFVGLPLRAGGNRVRSRMQCCSECTCVEKWCICMDRSRFGCYKDCGFCQCYDKPVSTCYCMDVLGKCPPSCALSPDPAAVY
ncbi:hypothetical protein Taro_010511 [Colocasia esculenta]|uniref:Uncharacterized protein n=1 Tax=Colocasia esculenta TaxID=4460 RepID=A0A843U7W1_COLES|nr:hypothetical protein [Colocasia esculenta]